MTKSGTGMVSTIRAPEFGVAEIVSAGALPALSGAIFGPCRVCGEVSAFLGFDLNSLARKPAFAGAALGGRVASVGEGVAAAAGGSAGGGAGGWTVTVWNQRSLQRAHWTVRPIGPIAKGSTAYRARQLGQVTCIAVRESAGVERSPLLVPSKMTLFN